MKKKNLLTIFLIVCSLVIVIMAMTLPSKKEYNVWLAEKYGIVATEDANITGIYKKDSMELFEMRFGRKGYGIFSIVTQVFQQGNELLRFKAIGIFNNYFILNGPESIMF